MNIIITFFIAIIAMNIFNPIFWIVVGFFGFISLLFQTFILNPIGRKLIIPLILFILFMTWLSGGFNCLFV